MESDHEEIESSKDLQQKPQKSFSRQERVDQVNAFPHILKRAQLIPLDSQNLI